MPRAFDAAAPGDDTQRSVGRPRDDAIDERILAEALHEIAHRGLAAFNLGAVARRAGVAKNSLYLRWPTREDLIRAALSAGRNAERPDYDWDLERDLTRLADEFAEIFSTELGLAAYYQLSVSALTEPELWAWGVQHVIQPAHAIPEDYLREAQRRGLARDDVDAAVIARMLVGAIYTEAIIREPHGDVPAAFRRQLVDHVLRLLTNHR